MSSYWPYTTRYCLWSQKYMAVGELSCMSQNPTEGSTPNHDTKWPMSIQSISSIIYVFHGPIVYIYSTLHNKQCQIVCNYKLYTNYMVARAFSLCTSVCTQKPKWNVTSFLFQLHHSNRKLREHFVWLSFSIAVLSEDNRAIKLSTTMLLSLLGGARDMLPQNFIKIRCSEVNSGASWDQYLMMTDWELLFTKWTCFVKSMSSYWLSATTMQILFVVTKKYIHQWTFSSKPKQGKPLSIPFMSTNHMDGTLVKMWTLQLLTGTPTT